MSLPGRFLELREVDGVEGGVRLFYHRSAASPGATAPAPPVLLVHGYLDSHYGWRHVIPALAEHLDVLAVDLPGFGESDRPRRFSYRVPDFAAVLHRFLDALAIDRVALLGHSLGGAVALEMALARPERVTRVAALAAAVYPVEPPPEARLALAPFIGAAVFKHVYRRSDLARVLRTVYLRDPRLMTTEMLDYWWDRLNRPGARDAAYATLQTIYQTAPLTPARLATIACPVLVLWGDEDHAQPLSSGLRLAHDVPGARFRPIPAAGHLAQVERPRAVVREALPFLLGERAAAEVHS